MIDKEFIKEELLRIDALNIGYFKKFRLRIKLGKASVDPSSRFEYYAEFDKYAR